MVSSPASSPAPLPIEPGEAEGDPIFGFDFPGLIEAPVSVSQAQLSDPVTSGADSALYSVADDGGDPPGTSSNGADEDENEDEDAQPAGSLGGSDE